MTQVALCVMSSDFGCTNGSRFREWEQWEQALAKCCRTTQRRVTSNDPVLARTQTPDIQLVLPRHGNGHLHQSELSPHGWPGGTPRHRLHSLSRWHAPGWLYCVRVVCHLRAIHLGTQSHACAMTHKPTFHVSFSRSDGAPGSSSLPSVQQTYTVTRTNASHSVEKTSKWLQSLTARRE